MKDVLEFIFSSFWHWLGTFVLLAVLVKWRIFYFGVSIGTKNGTVKKTSEDDSMWKQLAEIGKQSREDKKNKDK